MIVLGIDPWVRKLGYALVSFAGQWNIWNNQKTILESGILLNDSPIQSRVDRYTKMQYIMEFFIELSAKYTVDTLGIERLYFTTSNQSNAEFVYWIRSSLIIHYLSIWAKLVEVDPVQIKKYISWNAKASKELVQRKIMQLYWLGSKPEYNDSADALGVAWLSYVLAAQ